MKILSITLIFSVTSLFAQQTGDWLNNLENPKYPMFDELKTENLLTRYVEHDLSNILDPNSEFLGYIGSGYKRIEVKFNSVKRSETTQNIYYLTGYTTVLNNTCDFEGMITIEQFREFKNMYFGVDNKYSNEGFKAQGIAIGTYKLNENPKQKHVGTFQGIVTLWWFLDKNGEIQYYNLNSHSDRYKNNQYVGTWSEYGKNSQRTCNWGEHRIPFPGDLDIGAGEFSVNPKYRSNGWEGLNSPEIGVPIGTSRINEN